MNFGRVVRRLAAFEELALGWLLLGLAVLAFIQVVLRYAFHTGFSWGEEISRYLCVLLTLMGAAIGVRTGAHFSMDALRRLASPFWARILDAVVNLVCAAVYATVCGYGTMQVLQLNRFGSTSPALSLPMALPYAVIPLFALVMTLRSLLAVIRPRNAPDEPTPDRATKPRWQP
ncbi:MAG: TRAP transporter small permease [Deltaproteobacteria bacterium]|nr:TRAP transporter small permease [Candidatus Anaeroferrophillacea bacterium]